jgi:hypothetical protein
MPDPKPEPLSAAELAELRDRHWRFPHRGGLEAPEAES